jgi:hypothetical protein
MIDTYSPPPSREMASCSFRASTAETTRLCSRESFAPAVQFDHNGFAGGTQAAYVTNSPQKGSADFT